MVQCFAETGQYQKIILYSQKISYVPDYIHLFRNVVLRTTPDHAVEFAQMLLSDDAEPLANINQVCEINSLTNLIGYYFVLNIPNIFIFNFNVDCRYIYRAKHGSTMH